jgi:hypothetical protein
MKVLHGAWIITQIVVNAADSVKNSWPLVRFRQGLGHIQGIEAVLQRQVVLAEVVIGPPQIDQAM